MKKRKTMKATRKQEKRMKKQKQKQKKRAKPQTERRAADGSRALSASTGDPEADSSVRFWVVAFLDLLGYKKLLERVDLERFPTSDADNASLTKGFLDVFLIRRRLVWGIREFTDIGATFPGAPKVLQSLGADHVVLASSFGSDHEGMLRALHDTFVCAAVAALLQLEYGGENEETLPLRGGIDFGLGVVAPGDDFVVSPALGRAYELECKSAKSARIVIGSRVHNILKSAEAFVESNPHRDVARRLLAMTRRLIFKDTDGLDVLDFFGEQMRSVHPDDIGPKRADCAWRYVLAMEAKFTAEQNERVAAKYRWLVEYMRPRLSLWGVTAEP